MVERDTELVRSELIDRLKDLGLTEYESETLVSLIRLGTGTAKDVARTEDVPRTRVYDAAEALLERGLIDVQYSTPQKFSIISRESILRKLNRERENTITEIGELLDQLGPVEPQSEQMGVWTVIGSDAVSQRVFEFVDEADDQIVYRTVDELLTEKHLDHLREADERGVDVHVAGISETVQDQIRNVVPSAEVFQTLWEWADTPAGTLLVTDEDAALVSVRTNGHNSGTVEETAIWGRGEQNSLVVVLRAIFTWRLGDQDPQRDR